MTKEQIELIKQIDNLRIEADKNPLHYPQDYLCRVIEDCIAQFFNNGVGVQRKDLDKMLGLS